VTGEKLPFSVKLFVSLKNLTDIGDSLSTVYPAKRLYNCLIGTTGGYVRVWKMNAHGISSNKQQNVLHEFERLARPLTEI
jgi:hypothetical protein